MKVITPEISWHERDPIYSIDFQPGQRSIQRIASGGVDKIVRIWQMTIDTEGKGKVDFLSNLRRHTATVNAVRFSKNGELLATAGDDSAIILWKLSDVPTPANNIFAEDDVVEDKESWVCHKTLRGHLGDVADLCWSKDNRYLISGSVDNSAIVWDVVKDVKVAMFNEHKSYVQGVAFDPLGYYVATLSADRSLRLYNLNSKNCAHNVNKMTLPSQITTTSVAGDTQNTQPEAKVKPFRIFHDDSLRSFFRRLDFSPDGQLLIAPAGCMEMGDKVINATYVFVRGAFSKPALYFPSIEKTTTVVRVNPQLFQLRPVDSSTIEEVPDAAGQKEWDKHKSLFCLPYRIVLAVATEDSVLIYDTQQTMPVGLLKNIHFHQISDMSWTSNGKSLIISSTDGFCTIATFEDNELGIPYKEPCPEVDKANPLSTTKSKGQSQTGMDVDTCESPESNSANKPLPFSQYKSPVEKVDDSQTDATTPLIKSKIGQSIQTKAENDRTADSPKENKDKNEGTEASAKASKLTDQVEAIKIEEKQKESTDKDVNDKDKKGEIIETSNTNTEKKGENASKEAPKKKRIQLTTLSLGSKK